MSLEGLIGAVRARALNAATRTDQVTPYLPVIAPRLSPAELQDAEVVCGLRFPETLQRLYCEIGNGGFGPGYGFLPMTHAKSRYEDSIVDLFLVFSGKDADDPTWEWPKGLLPIVDFGCAIRACVDCATGQLIVSDPNLHESSWSDTFLDQGCTLDEWLARWCTGENLWKRIHGARGT